jgi:hypothetical protein
LVLAARVLDYPIGLRVGVLARIAHAIAIAVERGVKLAFEAQAGGGDCAIDAPIGFVHVAVVPEIEVGGFDRTLFDARFDPRAGGRIAILAWWRGATTITPSSSP